MRMIFKFCKPELIMRIFGAFFATQVEMELIDKLDNFVSNGKGDSDYEELFRKM